MLMSTLNEEGVMDVKTAACERLLASRVEMKLQVGFCCSFCCSLWLCSAGIGSMAGFQTATLSVAWQCSPRGVPMSKARIISTGVCRPALQPHNQCCLLQSRRRHAAPP